MIPHHGTPKLSAVSTGAVNGTVEQLMKFGHGFMGHQVLGSGFRPLYYRISECSIWLMEAVDSPYPHGCRI